MQLYVVLILAAAAVAKPLDDVTTITNNAEIEGSTAAPINILNQESNQASPLVGQQQQEAVSGRSFGSVTVLGDQVSFELYARDFKIEFGL